MGITINPPDFFTILCLVMIGVAVVLAIIMIRRMKK